MKKNKGIIILVIVLVLLILVAGGLLAYKYYYDKNPVNTISEDVDEPIVEEPTVVEEKGPKIFKGNRNKC